MLFTMDKVPVEKRGFHNWRKLFRKPTLYEWTILFMLILSLFMSWAYQRDIQEYRNFLKDIETNACAICQQQISSITPSLNLTNFTINEELHKGGVP